MQCHGRMVEALPGHKRTEVEIAEIGRIGEAAVGQPCQQRLGLARINVDIYDRRPLQEPLHVTVRDAAARGDDERGAGALELRYFAQMPPQPVLGGLADRATHQHDEIGAGGIRHLHVALLGEHTGQALGIGHVHLAADNPKGKAHRSAALCRSWGAC